MNDESCLSCKVANATVTPVAGPVLKTARFNVSQDVEYMVPGFVILASNRHFKAFDQMNDDELAEFPILLRDVRAALRSRLGIEDVYYFYNEDTRHHFHLWMIPRYEWMKQFGRSIESVKPALEHARLVAAGSDFDSEVAAAVLALKDELHLKVYSESL